MVDIRKSPALPYQGDAGAEHVLGRMDVPEFLWSPTLHEGDAAIFQVGRLEFLAFEVADVEFTLLDPDAHAVLFTCFKALQSNAERDFPVTDGSVHLHVGDAIDLRHACQVDVAAQSTPIHRTLHFPRGVGVAVREHEALEGHRDNQHAEDILAAGATHGREVHLACREANLSRFLSVHIHDRERIQIFSRKSNAPAAPALRDGDLPLIPGSADAPQVCILPAWVDVECLAVLLDVV